MKQTLAAFLAFLVLSTAGLGATMAFVGEIVDVRDPDARGAKDTLKIFTTEIAYYDYCSRGEFGRESVPGARAVQKVRKIGSVCMIDGQLVNAATFARALRPGQWAYVYEDTWLDLRTTPDHRWGEVVSFADGRLALREHRTHKDHHLPRNPPVTNHVEVAHDGPLAAGTWVQVHEAGPTVVSGFSADSAHDPAEWLPAAEGRRGFANDLSCPAVLLGLKTETPEKVLDVGVRLRVRRWRGGGWSEADLPCRKTTFVLDGKPVPPLVGFAPERHAVLGHYRSETSPHKIFVASRAPVRNATAAQLEDFPDNTVFRLDGLPATRQQLVGTTIRVFPGGETRRVVPLPTSL